jgi:hypothetical protein
MVKLKSDLLVMYSCELVIINQLVMVTGTVFFFFAKPLNRLSCS